MLFKTKIGAANGMGSFCWFFGGDQIILKKIGRMILPRTTRRNKCVRWLLSLGRSQ